MVDLDAIESAADRWSAAPTFKEANAIAARLCDAIPAFVAELRRLREREAPGTFADAIAAAAAIPKRLLDSMPAESIFPVTRGLMVRVEREIRALSPEATPPTFADGFARGIEAALERVRTIGAPTSAKALIALLDEEIRALTPAAVPGGDVAGLVEALRAARDALGAEGDHEDAGECPDDDDDDGRDPNCGACRAMSAIDAALARALSLGAVPRTFADGIEAVRVAIDAIRPAPTASGLTGKRDAIDALIALARVSALSPGAAPGGDVAGIVEGALRRALDDAESCLAAHAHDEPIEAALAAIGPSYGAIMSSAARMWGEHLAAKYPGAEGGAFTVGPCRATVERTRDILRNAVRALRAPTPAPVCPACDGEGRRMYGNTAGAGGGIGGQLLTDDVCATCKGSGKAPTPARVWFDDGDVSIEWAAPRKRALLTVRGDGAVSWSVCRHTEDGTPPIVTREGGAGAYAEIRAWMERGQWPDAEASTAAPAPLDGSALIAAERARHVNSEGWTAAHDDSHVHGEMAIAAAIYATLGTDAKVTGEMHGADHWIKPGGGVRELVKAGALIAAEIDRMLRAKGEPIPAAALPLDEGPMTTGVVDSKGRRPR